jgi:hypothetical protein
MSKATMSKRLSKCLTGRPVRSRAQNIATYREIRLAFAYEISGLTPERFNALALARMGTLEPTPANYVAAARALQLRCGRCAGTGSFITYVENNVPKGPGGICFRCEGKGVQTLKDAKRNEYHDAHQTIRM